MGVIAWSRIVFLVLSLPLSRGEALVVRRAEGMVVSQSPYAVSETADRLQAAIESRGMTLFARIDHAANAESVGQELPPTVLLLFGNPKVGTRLMTCSRTVAIDLPQKVLVWEDAAGDVWAGYNAPEYLDGRHDLAGCEAVLTNIGKALQSMIREATEE